MGIGRNDLCPCGSGAKYKHCCMNRLDEHVGNSDLPIAASINAHLKKGKISTCLYPDNASCSEKIVRAHSIQNHRILNRLASNGEVITIRPEITEESLSFSGKRTGIRVASTFSGFCGYHDKTIFQPIEDIDYTGTQQQHFLFAYRAFAFEYHQKMQAIKSFRQLCRSKPSIIREYEPWFEVYYKDYNASETDMNYYKKVFDSSLSNERYGLIDTLIFKYENAAQIAVCSAFYLEYDLKGIPLQRISSLNSDRLKMLILNIFPQENETIILVSWLNEDAGFYHRFGNQLIKSYKETLITALSNMIPSYCENVFIAPAYYDSLSDTEREGILDIHLHDFTNYGDVQKRDLLRQPVCNLFKGLK